MNWNKRIGITLVVLSFVFYGLIPLLPFLPLSTSTKVAAVPILALLGELVFWPGGALLGREVVEKYKARLNPCNWFGNS
ncbi:MAG: transporter suffix domain-containing protein [Anaerolineales bacterium]|nr:transporter suffix domain-containing protein [Anaerolineales bacterium]MBP6211288.1 transporter suffix domain-containing protein [Anaerolineales bacterium]